MDGWDRGQGWGRGWGGGGQTPRQGNRLRVTQSPGDTAGHREVVLRLDHVLDVCPLHAHRSRGTHIHWHRVWGQPCSGSRTSSPWEGARGLHAGSSTRVDVVEGRHPSACPSGRHGVGGSASPRAPRRVASAPRPASSRRSQVTIESLLLLLTAALGCSSQQTWYFFHPFHLRFTTLGEPGWMPPPLQ